MDHFQQAREFRDAGLFRDALACLEKCTNEIADKTSIPALRAELLERVGRQTEAQAIARKLLSSKNLGWNDKSICDFVLARIAIDRRDFDSAVAHLTRSIGYAQRAGDIDRTCAGQLKLLLLLADGAGTDAIGPLLSEVRANAVRSGNPRTLAAVHVYFAQMEGLRTSVVTSRRHIRLARQLLDGSPNAWLEAIVGNLELSLALMESEFEAAKECARVGFESSKRSGSTLEFAVNRSNAGYAHQILGELEEAESCFEQAIELFFPGSDTYNGTVDSLARVRLSQNKLDECERLLDQIDTATGLRTQRPTYVFRHVQFTRAELLLRKGDIEEAQHQLDVVLRMAREAGDSILTTLVLMEQATSHLRANRTQKAIALMEEVSATLPTQAADVYAKYQELLAAAATSTNHPDTAVDCAKRAERIYRGLRHNEALKGLQESFAVSAELQTIQNTSNPRIDSVLQSITAILSYFRHPEFVARELFNLVAATGHFDAVLALSRAQDGSERVLDQLGIWPPSNGRTIKRLRIGELNQRVVELRLCARNDLQSLATLQSIAILIAKADELKTARDERNERSSPWPIDDLPPMEGNHIITGHMRDLMLSAQKVARTNVTVLITGESGTGKEILARAIHEFSDRAQKPFVPFNCSAVPRDLLESQLFGHRRGAFTGAERDQLGLIRSAVDGTLFLDEIGDMSADLQPKLLRFLESGEIAPLGEPSPLTVNVRVVAATNANLEDLVRDGKFREDLFYRLNVVRLTVNPLRERRDEIPGMVNHFVAAAAREHKKGHLQVSEDTMERLLLYRWPGNVRQLQNEVRRMVALAEPNSTIEPESISAAILGAMPNLRPAGINGREIAIPLDEKLLPTLSRIEYEMIKAALREHHGRVEPAAKSLGISRKGLYLKRQRLGL